jgi:hypothetical protein
VFKRKCGQRNLLRMLAEAQAVAHQLQAARPPSLATIEALDGAQAPRQTRRSAGV